MTIKIVFHRSLYFCLDSAAHIPIGLCIFQDSSAQIMKREYRIDLQNGCHSGGIGIYLIEK